jgi:hypothetical protein
LSNAEDVYPKVARIVGYEVPFKILLVLIPDRDNMRKGVGWASAENTMGAYWAGSIRILSPRVWAGTEDPLQIARIYRQRGPLAHELTHLLLDYRTDGNYSTWFTEGLAQYVEYKLTGNVWAYPKTDTVEIYPLAALDEAFDSADQLSAYFEAFTLLKYQAKRYGEGSINKIIQLLGRGYSLEEAIPIVTKQNLVQWENDYRKGLPTLLSN